MSSATEPDDKVVNVPSLSATALGERLNRHASSPLKYTSSHRYHNFGVHRNPATTVAMAAYQPASWLGWLVPGPVTADASRPKTVMLGVETGIEPGILDRNGQLPFGNQRSTTEILNGMAQDADIEVFIDWFQSHGGLLDVQAMGIVEFPDSGRGAIALRDIPEGHTLFTLPRTLTLSTRTSPLPSLFGQEAWRAYGLHKGWVGLILCMMWEDAWAYELNNMDGRQGDAQTKWGPYVRTLPTVFDTPMFWSTEELEELRGTAVTDRIGRDDAERAYYEQLIPAIQASPTLFPPSHHGKWYTLDAYHCSGSRVLSRSFTISRWTDDKIEEGEVRDGEAEEERSHGDMAEGPEPKASTELSVHIDHVSPSSLEDTSEEMDSGSEDDNDDPSDVAMVPMADLLNARWGSENAKLFYEPVALRMVTTRNIRQGEQIFNTYSDPPNSDLLRRYGHVDLVQLGSSSSVAMPDMDDLKMEDNDMDVDIIKYFGNPSDIVEIRADLVIDVVRMTNFESRARDLRTRIEWWLDEGEDDVFVMSLPEPGSPSSAILLPGLISFIRLLILSEPDFESACSKGKLPKGKLKKTDVEDNKAVLEILDEVISQREEMYICGSVEDDEYLLSITKPLTKRKRHAMIVRLGEKRILKNVRQTVRMLLAELSSISGVAYENEKDRTNRDQKSGNGGKETGNGRKRAVNEILGGDRGHKKARK